MRQTGGTALGEISTRSSERSRAIFSASKGGMMPSCSPFSSITRISRARIRSLVRMKDLAERLSIGGIGCLYGAPLRPPCLWLIGLHASTQGCVYSEKYSIMHSRNLSLCRCHLLLVVRVRPFEVLDAEVRRAALKVPDAGGNLIDQRSEERRVGIECRSRWS